MAGQSETLTFTEPPPAGHSSKPVSIGRHFVFA